MTANRRKAEEPAVLSLLPAVGLLVLTLVLLSGFLIYQSVEQRAALLRMRNAQELPLRQAQQVRSQLDALVSKTVKLGREGNSNAQQILDAMRKQGVQFQP